MESSRFPRKRYLFYFVVLFEGVFAQITTLADLDSAFANVRDVYFDQQTIVPVQTISNAMNINVKMDLLSIVEFKDDEAVIRVMGYLTTTWTEERTVKIADDIYITIPASAIWTPPLVIVNSASTDDFLGTSTSNARFNMKTGNVIWKPWFHATVFCKSNLKFFPFDTHECVIKMACHDYLSSEVSLLISDFAVGTDLLSENNEWEITQSSIRVYTQNSHSYVDFVIKVKRNFQYHFVVIVYPVIIIGIIHLFVFLVPVDSQKRADFSISCILALVLLLVFDLLMIPQQNTPVCHMVYYLFVELFLNGLVTIICLLTQKFSSEKQTGRGCLTSVRNSIFGEPARKTQPADNEVRALDDENNKNGTHSTRDIEITAVTPQSAWNDDNESKEDAIRATYATNNQNDKQTGMSMDFLFFVLFLLLHLCFSVGFLVPLSLNVG